jgi:class 3 adenylate cyclase/streptogramin lyase
VSSTPELPSGTVTFLFSDIEGSTRLLEHLGRDSYESVLSEYSGIVRAAVANAHGRVVDTQGDSFFAVFRTAQDAAAAAVAAQRELEAHGWPGGEALRVRMGLHSAEPKTSGERYVGMGVNRAARIGSAAHGGQVLLSDATRALLEDDRPASIALRDLGTYRLKDIAQPVRLHQLVVDGLRQEFPRPRSVDSRRRLLLRRRSVVIALAVVLALLIVGAVAGILTADSGSAKPVSLQANSIAVFDPTSGKAVGDVPLGFSPSNVVAGGNQIWVLDPDGNTATAIDPTTLRTVRSVGLPQSPVGQWASGDSDWVAMSGAVELIGSGSGEASVLPLWRLSPDEGSGADCLEFVTGAAGKVYVSQGQDFAVLDARDGTILARHKLASPTREFAGVTTCYGARATVGGLFAVRDPNELGLLDPRTGGFETLVSTNGLSAAGARGLATYKAPWAVGFGAIWIGGTEVDPVTLAPGGVLARTDLGASQPRFKSVIGAGVDDLAVDPATGLWALDHGQEVLRRIEPKTGQVMRVIALHHFPCCGPGFRTGGVAIGHGRVWVALQSP